MGKPLWIWLITKMGSTDEDSLVIIHALSQLTLAKDYVENYHLNIKANKYLLVQQWKFAVTLNIAAKGIKFKS